jgi:hypothetical protein
MSDSENIYTFDYAISFAGEDRPIAEEIANRLSEGGANVFYDYYFKSVLLGEKLGQELPNIYGPSTRFFVPLISKYYAKKDYSNYEWIIAKEEETKRSCEFILPIRLDDSKLIGLHSDVVFLDLRKDSTETVTKILLEKLGKIPERENTDWVATVGLVINEVLENWKIPKRVPKIYAYLCDWLQQDLEKRLTKAGLEDWEFLEDKRDGEIFSLRFEFRWVPSEEPLDFGPLDWWEVLEVAPKKDIYPEE